MKPQQKGRLALPQRQRLATLLDSSMRRLSRAARLGGSSSPMFLALSASNFALIGDSLLDTAHRAAPVSADTSNKENIGEYAMRIKNRFLKGVPSEKSVDGKS